MDAARPGDSLFSALEENVRLFESLSDELRFQIKSTLNARIERLGLVTREEFDAVKAQLERTTTRIEQLEQKLKSD